jgi:ERCC4-type nuclease
MCVLIDDRGGATARSSEDHYPTVLSSLLPNSVLTRLDSGDVAFSGANDITIGIELKKVNDALSCIYSSRLSDVQLPAMAQAYDVRYLIVEELYRAEPGTGVLQRWRPFKSEKDVKCGRWQDAVGGGRNRVTYSTFELWLHSMSELGHARLERTADVEATAALIQSLYVWWNREDHKSFNVMFSGADTEALTRPDLKRRLAAQLPGVGWVRSKAVANYFQTARAMFMSSPDEWESIDGIGKGIATKVSEAMDA